MREWLLITVFLVFMTGIGIVTVQAIRNPVTKQTSPTNHK